MTSNRASRRLFLLLCALAASSGLATCTTITPREGWNERWGPLVPHESFPGDCSLCHLPERWDRLREDFAFDHAKETGHALRGAHEKAACLRCHNDFGPVKEYAARGCAGCHLDVHRHQLGGTCTLCHNEESWRPEGLIAEHARTRFPLVGVHTVVACVLCHVRAPTGDYRGAPVRCEQCHRDDLAQATSPDHLANGWTVSCERCHSPTTWGGAGFTHAFFPLTGSHAPLDCTSCHKGGVFSALPADCNSCHADDYTGAPNHVAGNFPRTCQNCHTTSSFKGAIFQHSFPLTAGHANLDCSRCHTGGTYGPIPTDCNSCHAADFDGASNHRTLGYPRTCQNCHTTARWEGAVFQHSFPITSGPHRVDCSSCHTSGNTSTFSCLHCHEHSESEMADEHDEEPNYRYTSAACLQCHPNGRE